MNWLRVACIVTNSIAAVLYWLLFASQARTEHLACALLFTFSAVIWVAVLILSIKTERYRQETERLYPRADR